MKAGFHSPAGAAMVRPHSRRTGYALPDIFDEVEEDLRAERARSFGRRFGGLAAAGVVAVLVGTAAYVWWGQQVQAQTEKVADRFIAAAQQADHANSALGGIDRTQADAAAAVFRDIAAHGPAGYKVLAQLRLAALQWQLGQKPASIATWAAVSDDTAAPQILRDLATVTSAQHTVDSGDPVQLRQTMEGLTAPANPWRPMAEQVLALLDVRQGKLREAGDIMRRLIVDPMAPEGIRQMMADLLTTLPPDAQKPPAPKTVPLPPPALAKPAAHG